MGAVSRGTNDFKPQVRNTKKVLVHSLDESAPFLYLAQSLAYLLCVKSKNGEIK